MQSEAVLLRRHCSLKVYRRVDKLTARSCRINMSATFSEMFPTNTVVVGPALSSPSLALTPPDSLFGVADFCGTEMVVGTRTCGDIIEVIGRLSDQYGSIQDSLKAEMLSYMWNSPQVLVPLCPRGQGSLEFLRKKR